ncbi:hypothetical protein LX36DRAFT_191012 [Colletotrichum falcatum]|nr:hypothetical protein LX36DRAFT_191012 [Colletotrichum falcatum]
MAGPSVWFPSSIKSWGIPGHCLGLPVRRSLSLPSLPSVPCSPVSITWLPHPHPRARVPTAPNRRTRSPFHLTNKGGNTHGEGKKRSTSRNETLRRAPRSTGSVSAPQPAIGLFSHLPPSGPLYLH